MPESDLIKVFLIPGQSYKLAGNVKIVSGYSTAGDTLSEIVYDPTAEELILTPLENTTGETKFRLIYTDKTSNLEIVKYFNLIIANIFRPRARIIRTIGQELISSDVIALVELIKNSYDAEATEIEISLNSIFSKQGEIIVRDNGVGMSYEKIVGVWLEPATPDKKQKGISSFSPNFDRRFLGEKGIGRFAVHRLGEKITLVSRAKNQASELLDYETKIVIDWSEFTEEKYLNEIPIHIQKIQPPEIFRDQTGTEIVVQDLYPWSGEDAVIEAATKIKGLDSPVKPKENKRKEGQRKTDPGFSVSINSSDPGLNKKIKDVKSLTEVLQTAFYRISGTVNRNGIFTYNYIFDRPDYQDHVRGYADNSKVELAEPEIENLVLGNPKWFEDHPQTEENSPGEFEINFFAWDLDAAAMKVAGLADYKRTVIQPNSGVRIYRDDFRVWPYGEHDNDWLSLDEKRLDRFGEGSVSRKQVVGIIHISAEENSKLKDQSNREGMIENKQYDQFYHLVAATFSVFARERKRDKILIDKLSPKSKLNDAVTQHIEELRGKLEKNQHTSLYGSNVDSLEKSYQEKINDVLERYMMAAGIGISYTLPIHEVKLRLTSIRHLIEDLQEKPELQDQFLRRLVSIVKETDDIVMAVSSIMTRSKKQKVSLAKLAKNIQILKESELRKFSIDFEITGDTEIEVEAVPGLLNTAVLNLVDNSIFWMRAKKIELREKLIHYNPLIIIELGRQSDGHPFLRIRDNGPGFQDSFDVLTEPYFSRKTDGLGLGLYLVKEIITRLGANINGYNDNGAIVEIIFKRLENGK